MFNSFLVNIVKKIKKNFFFLLLNKTYSYRRWKVEIHSVGLIRNTFQVAQPKFELAPQSSGMWTGNAETRTAIPASINNHFFFFYLLFKYSILKLILF